jgi:hypothetical protein
MKPLRQSGSLAINYTVIGYNSFSRGSLAETNIEVNTVLHTHIATIENVNIMLVLWEKKTASAVSLRPPIVTTAESNISAVLVREEGSFSPREDSLMNNKFQYTVFAF